MALKRLPQGERLLNGVVSALISAVATTAEITSPPASSKLPTYIEFEPDNETNRELVRVIGVSGNIVTIERGVNNGGVGKQHLANTIWKQKWTASHLDAIVNALETGYLMEDSSYTVTRNSATEFKIEGVDATDYYTEGRVVRMNGSDIGITVSSSFTGGDTVVTIESGTVPNPLTSVEIGIGPVNGLSKALATKVYDSNGVEVLKSEATASAVNEATLKNAATGGAPSVKATGDDTNIDLDLRGKGTGTVLENIRWQNNVTDSTEVGVKKQVGWGFLVGTGASSASEAITFPTAFATKVLAVIVTPLGYKDSSDPSGIGDFGNFGLSCLANAITTSGFTVVVNALTGTYDATRRVGYCWEAYGI